MTEYEMKKLCERNPDCGCDCVRCPIMGAYQRTELGLNEREEDE